MSKDIFVPLTEEVDSDYIHALWNEMSEAALPPKIDEVLECLPELEAEIFWLFFEKKRNQKEISMIMNIPQSTVSYRFRRAVQKASYLKLITSVNVAQLVAKCYFLKDSEKEILTDLFFTANQDLTGRKHKTRQSSVKWIFVKTKRTVEKLEMQDPDDWGNQYGLMLLLEQNLGVRIQ